jgi:hypothetical protein
MTAMAASATRLPRGLAPEYGARERGESYA